MQGGDQKVSRGNKYVQLFTKKYFKFEIPQINVSLQMQCFITLFDMSTSVQQRVHLFTGGRNPFYIVG